MSSLLNQRLIDLAATKLLIGDYLKSIEICTKLLESDDEINKEECFKILSKSYFQAGDIENEGKTLENWGKSLQKKSYEYSILQSQFFRRTSNSTKSLKILEEAKEQIDDDKKRNLIELEIVKTLWSKGDFDNAYDVLKTIDPSDLEIKNKISYHHAACLVLHDLDKSKQLISHANSCIEGYKKEGDIYSELISNVNKADSLWSLGFINSSIKLLENVLNEAKENELPHVIDIATICLANSLSEKGEYQQAANLYKEGISRAKEIKHDWDYIYAKIYDTLNDVRHNRNTNTNLDEIIDLCDRAGYNYLYELSHCLKFLYNYKVQQLLNSSRLISIDFNLPVSNILKNALLILSNNYDAQTISSLLSFLGKTEGFKFFREIVIDSLEKIQRNKLTDNKVELEFISRWLGTYVPRIESSETRLKACDYKTCEARCCYDGVYLLENEEEMIREVVNKYPKHFEGLPEDFIVDGSWGGKIAGRKTQVKSHDYTSPDFPSHFNKTRCVFSNNEGACTLQILSEEKSNNPWTFKPSACKVHPLQTKGFEYYAPPKHSEKDKYDIGLDYPGYVSYTPCGVHRTDGELWTDNLKDEIQEFQKDE
jgi:hypothetical protein